MPAIIKPTLQDLRRLPAEARTRVSDHSLLLALSDHGHGKLYCLLSCESWGAPHEETRRCRVALTTTTFIASISGQVVCDLSSEEEDALRRCQHVIKAIAAQDCPAAEAAVSPHLRRVA